MLIKGPARIEILKGEVEVFGAVMRERSWFTAIKNRQYPVKAFKDSTLKIIMGEGSSYQKLDFDPIPPDWRFVAQEISKLERPVVMIIGGLDAGKSGFTLFLSNVLYAHGRKVAIIDTDVGQSDIGPPGTIGLAIISKPTTNFSELKLMNAYFIGDKTPAGHLLPMVTGTRVMIEEAFDAGCDSVIINTTGMIHGSIARALKHYKIENINPTVIVALQREDELEPILKPFDDVVKIFRLKTPSHIAKRSRSERSDFRSLKLTNFLMNCKKIWTDLHKITLLNTLLTYGREDAELIKSVEDLTGIRPEHLERGEEWVLIIFNRPVQHTNLNILRATLSSFFSEVKIILKSKLKGLMLGLYDKDKKFLGIGVLEDIDFNIKKMLIRTPVRNGDLIKYIYLGYLIIGENGSEIGSLKPGFI